MLKFLILKILYIKLKVEKVLKVLETVPILELLGCLLLSTFVREVKRVIESRVVINNISCWTDSEVAFTGIKGRRKLGNLL